MFVLDEGFGFAFKKSQADIVSRIMSDENVKYFKVWKIFRLFGEVRGPRC